MSVHISTRGQGTRVIALHSGGMSGRQWRRLSERLEGGHRILLPDFLGSGENPPWSDDADFHWGMDADVVEEILLADDGRAHLVGHSYGGLIAVTVAQRHPEAVRSLVVYDPVAMGIVHAAGDAEAIADLARTDVRTVDDAHGGGEAWLTAFVDWWNGPGAWTSLPAPTRDAFLRVGRKVYYEVRSLLSDRTPAGAYARVTAPALVLSGERSPLAARRVGALLAAAMPHGRQQTIAGAGHMGPITHAGEVNEAIAAHIAAAAE
ncbi:MAG: alpha/beta hydrolase [Polyangiaceae bacterium]